MPTRRSLIAAATMAAFAPRTALAAGEVGTTLAVEGEGSLQRGGDRLALVPGLGLFEGDVVVTGSGATAALELFSDTRINLGAAASFRIDRFAADIGGTITVQGPLVFDRPEDMAPMDLTVQVAFAQIGVRGTEFFAGPSRGVQSVFVRRGRVAVAVAGVSVSLGAGEGVELPGPDMAPGPVVTWGEARIREAYLSAGVTPPG